MRGCLILITGLAIVIGLGSAMWLNEWSKERQEKRLHPQTMPVTQP